MTDPIQMIMIVAVFVFLWIFLAIAWYAYYYLATEIMNFGCEGCTHTTFDYMIMILLTSLMCLLTIVMVCSTIVLIKGGV